jgi:sulfhydrogenase subunit gamma (sulfur reductase)
MTNPYLPNLASITAITEEAPNIRTFTVSFKEKTKFDPQPGQFVEFSMFGYGEFPVSISGLVDAANGTFQTTVRRMGGVTEKIGDLKVGSTVGIRGPFGKGYPLDKMAGKDAVLVAGGMGMASIKFLADNLLKNRDKYGRIILLYGAATPADMIYKNIPMFSDKAGAGKLEVLLTVDKADSNWKSNVGMVTALVSKIQPPLNKSKTMIAACGPSKMMKAVVDTFTGAGFSGEQLLLSFERRMQCGMGMCGHCMLDQKRVCLDGPVIAFHDVKDSLEQLF